jgi:hypothetical protein
MCVYVCCNIHFSIVVIYVKRECVGVYWLQQYGTARIILHQHEQPHEINNSQLIYAKQYLLICFVWLF